MYFSGYHFAVNPADYFSSYYFAVYGSGGVGHLFFNDYFIQDYFIGKYFLNPTTTTVSSAYSEDYRLGKIWWIPRWMEPNYTTDSPLRDFYHLGLVQPRRSIDETVSIYGRTDFFSSRCQDRIAYVLPINIPESLPTLRMVTPYTAIQPTTEIPFKSFNDFLFEREYPVATIWDGKILLKNLSVATQITPTSSGYQIDLDTLDAAYDIHPDAAIVVTDYYGDRTVYSQDGNQIVNGKLYVGVEAYFVVSYLSSALHSAVVTGSIYITVDGTKYTVKPYYLDNIWDNLQTQFATKRSASETNFVARTKVQSLAVADKETTRIGASLGFGGVSFWDTTASSFSFPVTGVTSCDISNLAYTGYKLDYPVRDGNTYRMSISPAPPYMVFYNNRLVDSSSYSISGYVLTPTVSALLADEVNNLYLLYKRTNVTKTLDVSGKLTSLGSDRDLGYITVAYTTGVTVNSTVKKIKQWQWDRTNNAKSGMADFG